MKRIILDHFRRRAWIFALGSVVQLGLGYGQAALAARGRDDPLAILQFQLGVFTGAFLLSLDLQRGIARTLATFPLPTARLGRAWWLATVAIPAGFYIVLLSLGTTLFHVLHPGVAIAWHQIAASVLTLLLTMGASFTLVLKMNGFGTGAGWQRALSIASGILWGLLIGGGYLIVQNPGEHPARLIFSLILGVSLTVVGGLKAGSFAADRAGFRPAPENKTRTALFSSVRAPRGLGGLPLLIVQTSTSGFLIGLAMLLAPPLLLRLQSITVSWSDTIRNAAKTGFSPFWFVLIFALAPALMQLRHLRTLPLSGGRLAAALLAMLLLPILALGALSTALCASFLGAPAALAMAQGNLLTLVSAALVFALIFTVVAWLGLGAVAYGLTIASMIGAQFVQVWLNTGKTAPHLSLGQTFALAAVTVAIVLFLIRLALERSTHVYRASIGGPFSRAWGLGR